VTSPFPFERRPVDMGGQLRQRVLQIDQFVQPSADMSALCGPASFGPIQASEICKELASILAKACKCQLRFFYFLNAESNY